MTLQWHKTFFYFIFFLAVFIIFSCLVFEVSTVCVCVCSPVMHIPGRPQHMLHMHTAIAVSHA